ncbi:WD40 repeat domain-containing protein [Streptomyces sp. NPDC003374]
MTTLAGGLPVPWREGAADIDVGALLRLLDARPEAAGRAGDLAVALRHASARVRGFVPAGPNAAPLAVRHAQAVVEAAVEWRMPEVERWAVAWLRASRRPYLRLRWSSRSRDGRARLDGRATGEVRTMAGFGTGVCLGTEAGVVETWTPDGGSTPIGSVREAVWAVAAHRRWLFATGAHAHSWGRDPAGGSPWPEPSHTAGVSCAAIGPDGLVVCGDERGVVRCCAPGGRWTELPVRQSSKVLAVAVDSGRVSAVWRDGAVAVMTRHGDTWQRHTHGDLGGPVGCAAWSADGRLAFVPAGTAAVRIREGDEIRTAWSHHGVRAVAWSSAGRLATAGADHHVRVASPLPGADPDELGVGGRVTAMAFAGDRFLVTAHGRDLVQWDLHRSGSDDPTFEADDEITAVGLAPDDRASSAAGSRVGLLWQYDGHGVPSPGSPARVRGTVHQLVAHRGGWLVACHSGAYWWRPPAAPRRLSNRMCLAVAATSGTAVFGCGTSLVRRSLRADGRDLPGGGRAVLREFAEPVLDLAVAADGCLAARDRGGTVVVWGPDGTPRERDRTSDRLLACLPGERLLTLAAADGVVSLVSPRGSRAYARLPPGAASVAATDDGALVAAFPDAGLTVVDRSGAAGAGGPVVVSEVPGQFSAVAVRGRRIVAAGRGRVAGYDREDPGSGRGPSWTVPLRVVAEGGDCRVRLPDGAGPVLPAAGLARFRDQAAGDSVRALSDAVHLGARLGDRLWAAGLDREIDRARGDRPDGRVRLDWLIEEGPFVDLPWELLHPALQPLPWFAEPPVTMVRVVRPDGEPAAPDGSGERGGRPRLLVVRTDDPVLAGVDAAYDMMRRRTRRTDVRLVSGMPEIVRTTDHLDRALRAADIVHLWAHSGPDGVELPARAGPVPVEDMARRIAATGARLVVLVGCSSAALGRETVRRGVAAVVGMRVAVYSHTVQPLVEELTARALTGTPVDLAFAEALRHYVLTGQPGAPAVPLLHLAAGSDGRLFPAPDHT